MATDLDKVTAAFRALATIALPDGFLADVELAVGNANLEATRAQRAARLLATCGPDDTAAIMRCGRTQVYVWASQARKRSEIVRKTDESQTQAAYGRHQDSRGGHLDES